MAPSKLSFATPLIAGLLLSVAGTLPLSAHRRFVYPLANTDPGHIHRP